MTGSVYRLIKHLHALRICVQIKQFGGSQLLAFIINRNTYLNQFTTKTLDQRIGSVAKCVNVDVIIVSQSI